MPELVIRMAGEPVPQNQGKAGRWRSQDGREGVTIRQPSKVRHFKIDLQELMYRAAVEAGMPANSRTTFFGSRPLELSLTAVFSCPTSQYRKREPLPRRPHVGQVDLDNLTKPVGDAGQGVLWDNDGQICRYYEPFEKWIGAQGEAPYIEIRVRPLAEIRSTGGDADAEQVDASVLGPPPMTTGAPEASLASGAPLQPPLFGGIDAEQEA